MCFTLHRMGMKGEDCYRDENVCVCHPSDTPSRNGYNISPIVNRKTIVRDSLSFFHIHSCLFRQAGEMLSLAFKIMNVSRRGIKTIDHFISVHISSS